MLGTNKGFTLIEVVISLTIMAVVVTILYFAFSIGLSTWQGQSQATDRFRRLEKVTRLLQEDFEAMRPYSFRSEKGELFFNLGQGRYFFYVTTNGLGSQYQPAGPDRTGLFFSLLMLVPAPDGTHWQLLLYKTPWPEQALFDLFVQVKTMGQAAREMWQADSNWQDKSLVLLSSLREPRLAYQAQAPAPFADWRKGPAQELLVAWDKGSLPGAVSLGFQFLQKEIEITGRPVYCRIEIEKEKK